MDNMDSKENTVDFELKAVVYVTRNEEVVDIMDEETILVSKNYKEAHDECVRVMDIVKRWYIHYRRINSKKMEHAIVRSVSKDNAIKRLHKELDRISNNQGRGAVRLASYSVLSMDELVDVALLD